MARVPPRVAALGVGRYGFRVSSRRRAPAARRATHERGALQARARAGSLLLALVLLFGVLRGGARYFYCPQMDATLASSCCERVAHGDEGEHADASDAPSVDEPDCCKARRVATLPAMHGASAPPHLDVMPRVAILAPFDLARASRERSAIACFLPSARAGPPSAAERRAHLMVWNS